MIDWLGGYLQQLIIIILIATFLELLLPNTTFERYVRLVMGLLMLFWIMKPVFLIFNDQIDWNRWMVSDSDEINLPSLTDIQSDAEKLKKDQTEFIHKQASEQIEQQTKALLSKKFRVDPKEVVATIEEDGDRPKIKEIKVELPSHEDQMSRQSQPTLSRDDNDQTTIDEEKDAEQLNVNHKKIAAYLAHYWGLEEHQLQVF